MYITYNKKMKKYPFTSNITATDLDSKRLQ